MIHTRKKLQTDGHILIFIAAILIIIGLVFIYSASSVYAIERFNQSYYFVKKQLIAIMLGFIGMACARYMPLIWIKKLSPWAFFGSFILTAATFIPQLSLRVHGSSRWLKFGSFSFQPSELFKISLILYVAYLLTKEKKNSSIAHTYIPLIVIMGMTCAVLLKQPDFGLTVTLCATIFAMLFVTQPSIKYIMIALGALLPAAFALIVYKPYRLKRILTFLDPWSDPQGAGFQIIQSLIAIGSGGFWGLGISQSKQKFFYLPMQHTDFIFAIIAEETGLFGASILIILYTLFLYFGMRIFRQLTDSFSALATFGFIILITLQTVINLAVATGLAPTKGIGMPFVSYGNTALICAMAILGLISNMIHAQK